MQSKALNRIISQKQRTLKVCNLVLQKVEFGDEEKRKGKLADNGKGSYEVIEVLEPDPRPWTRRF